MPTVFSFAFTGLSDFERWTCSITASLLYFLLASAELFFNCGPDFTIHVGACFVAFHDVVTCCFCLHRTLPHKVVSAIILSVWKRKDRFEMVSVDILRSILVDYDRWEFYFALPYMLFFCLIFIFVSFCFNFLCGLSRKVTLSSLKC